MTSFTKSSNDYDEVAYWAYCPRCDRDWRYHYGHQGDMEHCVVCKTELIPGKKEELDHEALVKGHLDVVCEDFAEDFETLAKEDGEE